MKRLAFVLCILALGCTGHDGDSKSIMPTVQSTASEASVLCYQYGTGRLPKQYKIGNRMPDSVCFVDGVCYWGCPR